MAAERTTRVYVGGLSDHIKKEDLETEFEKYGKLNSVWVAFNPPGFAFVEFFEESDAETACDNLNGVELLGSKLRVEIARGKSRRGGFRGGRGGPPFRGGNRGGGGGGGGFRGGRGRFDSYGGGGGGGGGRGGRDGGYGGGRDFGRRSDGFGGGRNNSYRSQSGGGGGRFEGGSRFRSRSPPRH